MQNWGRLGVFDLETTGVDIDTARIVSACVAVLEPAGEVVARWDWLADPGVEIPEAASAVHGITTERARREGRPAALVVAEISATLRALFGLGMPVVVYNAPYDLSLLDREARRYGLEPIEHPTPVLDPLVLDKAVDRYRKGKRTLTVTAEAYGVKLDDAHDAGADAVAAGRVAQAVAARYPDQLDIPLADLHGRQEVWFAQQAASFQEYIRRVKGDDAFVAETSWPIRPASSPASFQDTAPIPAPEPRPGRAAQLVLDGFRARPRAVEAGRPPIVETGVVDAVVAADPAVPPAAVAPAATPSAPVETPAPAAAPATPAASAAPDAPLRRRDQRPTSYADAPPPRRRIAVLRVAAGIITDPAGRTLLVRKRGTTAFMQAGGKIEEGESALDALARELREELGLELDPDTTEYLGSHRAEAANETDTVIRAEVFALAVGDAEQVARGEIDELVWLDDLDAGVELAPLTRDTILPLWAQRRASRP